MTGKPNPDPPGLVHLLRAYQRAVAAGLSHARAVKRLRRRYPLRTDLVARVERWMRRLAPPAADATPLATADTGPELNRAETVRAGLPALPGYEVLRELGRGGMGVVYLARDLPLQRQVAVKMLGGTAALSEASLRRFQIEAEAIAKANAPNIIQIYETGTAGNSPYLVCEYADAGSLADALGERPLPALEAARLVEIIARATHTLHRLGIVHRDLKPGNILLARTEVPGPVAERPFRTADYVPKISDFGLAKFKDNTAALSTTGEVIGTPAYMAPEQTRGRSDAVGPAADVYALGVILYECLTKRPPFVEDNPLETMLQICTETPPRPTQFAPRTPPDLETICLKCLEKDPRHRYASALELAEDLHRLLHHEPIRARPAGRIERTRKWARRHPAKAALAGATVLILLLLAIGVPVLAAQNVQLGHSRDSEQEARQLAEAKERQTERQRRRAEGAEHSARVDAARNALRRGNWKDALTNYKIAIAHNRADAEQLKIERLRCWFTYRDRPRLKRELDRLARRQDLEPRLRALVTLHRGDYLMSEQARTREARQLVEEALRGAVLLPAADVAYARGLLAPTSQESAGHFRAALRLDPFHHRANSALTCELLLTGRFDEARRTAAFMRRIYPNDPVSSFALTWIELLEGNLAASRAERRSLEMLLGDATRRKQLRTFFVEMERVVTTTADWEAGKLALPLVVLRYSLSAARLSGMGAQALEPIGFGAPNVARLFSAVVDVRQAIPLWQFGLRDGALLRLNKATRTHPEACILFLAAMVHAENAALHASRRRTAVARREAAAAADLAYRAAEAPTLLPRSPYRYHARLLGILTDYALLIDDARIAAVASATLVGLAATPSSLPGLTVARPVVLDARRPGRLNHQVRRLIEKGREQPAARRTLLPQALAILPPDMGRRLLDDWQLDEPENVRLWRLRAALEHRAGDPSAALRWNERILARLPHDRAALKGRRQALEALRRWLGAKPQ